MSKINRAFPSYEIIAPLKDVKDSVNKICGYIQTIMLLLSITSIVIAALILFLCNYLHVNEIKKDIGLVRCLGVKEKESRKFLLFHSFLSTGLSFVLSSIELVVVSLVLSKTLADTLYIESTFVLNPLSLVFMFLTSALISIVSSLLITTKIKKLNPLECLR